MTAPKIPSHTCPMIDQLKKRIEEAYHLADTRKGETVEDLMYLLRDIAHELRGEADALETLRDANLALRNAAEYWEQKAEQLESEAAT